MKRLLLILTFVLFTSSSFGDTTNKIEFDAKTAKPFYGKLEFNKSLDDECNYIISVIESIFKRAAINRKDASEQIKYMDQQGIKRWEMMYSRLCSNN